MAKWTEESNCTYGQALLPVVHDVYGLCLRVLKLSGEASYNAPDHPLRGLLLGDSGRICVAGHAAVQTYLQIEHREKANCDIYLSANILLTYTELHMHAPQMEATLDCSILTIRNRTNGFSFGEFIPLYKYLHDTCPRESDIFFQGTRMWTDSTCRKITGLGDSIWRAWTPYPIEDIWTRIVTWKLPLFQLVGQFPRAPLGLSVEIATYLHVMGDPLDSITSMLLTLSMCRSRVELAKYVCQTAGIDETSPEFPQTWKRLAIIMVSYDECGKSDEALGFCGAYLQNREHPRFEDDIRPVYEESADCLAADRQTKTLPVALAESFFIGGWVIALVKAASSEPNPTNWPNIEIHSVAFSGLYLWVASAVVVACFIGVSQTETSIPRLLQGMEYHLPETRARPEARRPSLASRKETSWCVTGHERAIKGGLNSWRPNKWVKRQRQEFGISTLAMVGFVGAAMITVVTSYATAIILSYYVPPQGPDCRHIPESLMFLIWLMSFTLECLFDQKLKGKLLFWSVFTKDLLAALSNIAIVVITQWGVMNRCGKNVSL
ncbi:hypothetical protein P280DRAFT_510845 [Massarina eburnea CBS 473.64]|uniref:Uncharacterized protein n=1 Tax=Massarina eburnea CBS 473.64 TaxID=1395130 RepID=A0A6A6RJX2_9PLEO|nr:hypothetical protein P280DRAFT_510845 [Massarina eburnea CBS 473.64]